MKHHLPYILLLLTLLPLSACASAKEGVSQEEFNRKLLSAFYTQDPHPNVVNGTLQFDIDNQTKLFIRNAQLTLQIPIDPFIQAGLEQNDDIRISPNILYNSSNQMLIIADSHVQTLDFQFITDKEIISDLYAKTQEEITPFIMDTIDDHIYLSDKALLLKFNEGSYQVGIHHQILTDVGVDLDHLPNHIREGNYIIILPYIT